MKIRIFVLAAGFAIIPGVALAYGGPGSGLSAIGSLLSVLAALAFAVVGFVWYPIKRLLRFIRLRFKREILD